MRRPPAGALRAALGLAALALAACAAPPEPPAPYGVGDRLAPLVLEDAHGSERRVDASVRWLLFTRDMDADALVDEVLADAPEGLLAERDAVYVADISGMPGVIARLFAIPSLRERSYPMLLDRSGEATARLPAAEGRVTLLRLEGLRVAAIERIASAEALREALRAGAARAPDARGAAAAAPRASPPASDPAG